jgi:LmbE family N-acetylglucosaminyl deacetylase|tara:strand:- start:8351 stop:9016 length:666 start_codon:yes stop_codon:yes gene_type:complete
MKILVIAPHMDDEVLGCGGAISKHVEMGDIVHVCFVANRIYNHKLNEKQSRFEKECSLKAKKILGYQSEDFLDLPDERLDACIQDIIIPLEKCLKNIKPQIVYVNHQGDNNQDHKAVFQSAMVALRPLATEYVQKVLSYEVPSSTDQSPPFNEFAFLPNYYINIQNYLGKKIDALNCYQTEKRESPHPRSERGITVQAMKRGGEIGLEAAEAFMIIREKWG